MVEASSTPSVSKQAARKKVTGSLRKKKAGVVST
jgi:hypothetical protein